MIASANEIGALLTGVKTVLKDLPRIRPDDEPTRIMVTKHLYEFLRTLDLYLTDSVDCRHAVRDILRLHAMAENLEDQTFILSDMVSVVDFSAHGASVDVHPHVYEKSETLYRWSLIKGFLNDDENSEAAMDSGSV